MRNIRSLRWIIACGAAMALAASPERASASAFQLVEQNGSGLGNAHSGQAAAAEDASTIFWNPAGMTFLPLRQVVVAGTIIRPITKFRNEGSVPGPLPGTRVGGNGGDAGGINLVPNAYLSVEVLPNLVWAGIGVNSPYGLVTEWDDGWVGRFHALKSDVKTIDVNPSVAVKLTDWFSVGGGVSAQWIDAELTNAVNYSAIVAGTAGPAAVPTLATCPGATTGPPLPGVNCEGVGSVKGSAWSFGWNAGVMLNSAPTRTRLGVAYRSAIDHDVTGTVTFTNRPAALAARLPDGDVKTTINLPDTVSVAVAQGLGDRLQLLTDFTFTHWNRFQALSIFRAAGTPLTQTPLEFKNSWRLGVGANYQVLDPLKLRVGVAYDESPVKDAHRTPRLPDQDRLWLATGAQWAFGKAAAVDLGFAWLFVSEGRSRLGQPPPFNGQPQAPRGTLVGSYIDTNVWIASAQARYSF